MWDSVGDYLRRSTSARVSSSISAQPPSEQSGPPTSFTTKRISSTTFAIREDDAYGEHPLIYAKLHPKAPVLVLTDTGCDAPKHKLEDKTYTHLKKYLESYPDPANSGKPLNPDGERRYIIICTHCHYDHTLGLPQFCKVDGAEIVASAAGRDFIESDLDEHGIFKYLPCPVPEYKVTKWAYAFERLSYPLSPSKDVKDVVDLGITIFATPGHTPDELAWYDNEEKHLYVGDSFYREGEDGMEIIFPKEGSLIEWVFSMQKLSVYVRGENARLESEAKRASAGQEWVRVAKRVLVSCGHQTCAVDGAEILDELERFAFMCFIGKVPVVKSREWRGETVDLWRETTEKRTPMSILAPRRLMVEARKFFRSGEKSAESLSEDRLPWAWAN